MKKIIPLFLILLLVLSACNAKEVALRKPEDIYKPKVIENAKPETVIADLSSMFTKTSEKENTAEFDASAVKLYEQRLKTATAEWNESITKVEYRTEPVPCADYETAVKMTQTLKTLSDEISKVTRSEVEFDGWDFDKPVLEYEKIAYEARQDLLRLAAMNEKDDPLTIKAHWENGRHLNLIINQQKAVFIFRYEKGKK